MDINQLHLRPDSIASDYGLYCRPALAQLLHAVGLDVSYIRAEGDYLWMQTEGDPVRVLDLVGGYGANLFGHNHPELTSTLKQLLDARTPFLAQGSIRQGAASLAQLLTHKLGDYICLFTNSGAETIEAAIKHAYLSRPRPLFWALKGAFHGKTTGALQMTPAHRDRYKELGPAARFIDPFCSSSWEQLAQDVDSVCAILIEPVMGEGGIRILPRSFLEWITSQSQKHGIPLIVDEIQTGLGRTGTFTAAEQLGISPDYICLSKSLGGGITKIGALVIKRAMYHDTFSIEHTSTFAEDDISCLIARKALDILDQDHLTEKCKEMGQYVVDSLKAVQREFPGIIKDVRGIGLMAGLELQDLAGSASNALDLVSRQGLLGYMVASYLLHVHRVRILPTLSQPYTLRIEPSAYITKDDIDVFISALRTTCKALVALDIVHLTGHLIGVSCNDIQSFTRTSPFKKELPQTTSKTAFISHFILPEHIRLWDAGFERMPIDRINPFLDKVMSPFAPALFDQLHVQSATGERVHLSSVGLYMTSKTIIDAWKGGETTWLRGRIEHAVALARDNQCSMIGLGGYSSIVMGNGLKVKTKGIGITTGNSLTVGMGVLAIQEALNQAGMELKHTRMAVVGALGNIARTYALLMAPEVAEIVLIVQNTSNRRVRLLTEEIKQQAPCTPIQVSDSLEMIQECGLVVSASNSTSPLIHPKHLSCAPTIICDLALPVDVDPAVQAERPETNVIHGGIVKLPPGNESFIMSGLALPPGHVYACIAETLLFGLEGIKQGTVGAVTQESVKHTLQLAAKHGFTLGHPKKEPLG